MSDKDYILGSDQSEIDRLKFQHMVWRNITDGLLNRIGIKKGWKCLDAGSGPGFVSYDLLKLVGDTGEVTALEPAESFVKYMNIEKKSGNLHNFKVIKRIVEDTDLPENYYDYIFSRWVIAFVPDPVLFLSKLVNSLKTGGVISIEDYAYEGMGLYPHGDFNLYAADSVKKYYRSGGGDLYITTKIPSLFRKLGVETIDYKPNCQAGNPESSVFKWAYNFFTLHTPQMAEKSIIEKDISDKIISDWNLHKENIDSVFFSPLVVDVSGRKIK